MAVEPATFDGGVHITEPPDKLGSVDPDRNDAHVTPEGNDPVRFWRWPLRTRPEPEPAFVQPLRTLKVTVTAVAAVVAVAVSGAERLTEMLLTVHVVVPDMVTGPP